VATRPGGGAHGAAASGLSRCPGVLDGARGKGDLGVKIAAASTTGSEEGRGKPRRAALVRHRAAPREQARPGVHTPRGVALAVRQRGFRGASACVLPREARGPGKARHRATHRA
jgi:hypothetical protein